MRSPGTAWRVAAAPFGPVMSVYAKFGDSLHQPAAYSLATHGDLGS
jgi:hypothetical protein